MTIWPDSLAARPHGVVFDCDGLLMDTEPSWEWANAQLFATRGRDMADVDTSPLYGRSPRDSAVFLAQWLDEPGGEAALFDEVLETVAGRIESEARAMPGAVELVGSLREQRVPLAVASNSPRPIIELALRLGGLDGAFDVVVSSDDVPHPKPAPDLYLLACSRLEVAPSAAVGVEDSRTGLAAVRAAGLRSIGVPSQPGDFPADWVVASLADPTVAEWVSSWA